MLAAMRLPEADEFPVYPAVPQGRVLRGQAQDEVADLPVDWWPPGWSVRIGPVPGGQLAVPAQQGGWGDEERPAVHRCRGSSRDNAANTTRSSGRRSGRCTCRRSTAT